MTRAEEAIQFWGTESSKKEVLVQITYESHGKVQTTNPWRTSEINHISQSLAKKKVKVTESSSFGLNLALQPEQENAVWMKDVLRSSQTPDPSWWILLRAFSLHQWLESCYKSTANWLGAS